jgi:peptidoglycan/xylan/chitin deacetylase (PgdA/CDA1 family)
MQVRILSRRYSSSRSRVSHNDELDRTERRDLLRRVRRALGYPADWRTELFMDKESIRSLMGKGFEVGCHSMEHEYLSRLSEADLLQDIGGAPK